MSLKYEWLLLVTLKYDRTIKLPAYPADAKVVRAAIIPPSLVSDRYVQVLDFSSCGGKCGVLPSGARIDMSQTASPVELEPDRGLGAALTRHHLPAVRELRQRQMVDHKYLLGSFGT